MLKDSVNDASKRLPIRMACIDAPETAQRPTAPHPGSDCRSWPRSVRWCLNCIRLYFGQTA